MIINAVGPVAKRSRFCDHVCECCEYSCKGQILFKECQESIVNLLEYQLILVIPILLASELLLRVSAHDSLFDWWAFSAIRFWISGNVIGRKDNLSAACANGERVFQGLYNVPSGNLYETLPADGFDRAMMGS
jgi:hypothetical protein